jgi:uncharacterized protein YndB with AHSA1/START domain
MTTMTAQATQVYSVFVRATPDQLWDAITKPEFTRRYFYGSEMESTYEAGAKYCGFSAETREQYVDGEIVEATPPRKLVTTWRATWAEALAAEPPSRVTWEIEPVGEGVSKLTVVHDRLEESPATAESVAGGWSYVLSGMKSIVETGRSLEE